MMLLLLRTLTTVLLHAWLQRRHAVSAAAHHRGNNGVDDSDVHCTAGCGDDNAAAPDCGHAEPEQQAAVPLWWRGVPSTSSS
jgi:hypothetical protein